MPGAPLGVSPALAAATPVVAAMPLVTDALAATTAFVAPDVFRGIDTLTGTVPADAFTGTLGADAFATPDTPDSFAAGAFAATDTFATATGADVSVGFGAVPVTGYETKAAKALTFARAQIGRPCVRGAAGPDSYDAPGLTQAAWKAAGVVLPRTAQDQAALGTAIPLTDIRPGDLIFFYDTNGHVGVYAGDAMMIHAPGPGACIREESIFFAGNAAIHAAARPA
ncbi:C40 family peptidase [Streptomyces chiangmaiensis]